MKTSGIGMVIPWTAQIIDRFTRARKQVGFSARSSALPGRWIRWPARVGEPFWIGGQGALETAGTWEAAVALAPDAMLWIPAVWCSVWTITLPPMRAALRPQAALYHLENQLAADPESLCAHVYPDPHASDGETGDQWHVVCVAKSCLQIITDTLEKTGVYPRAWCAEQTVGAPDCYGQTRDPGSDPIPLYEDEGGYIWWWHENRWWIWYPEERATRPWYPISKIPAETEVAVPIQPLHRAGTGQWDPQANWLLDMPDLPRPATPWWTPTRLSQGLKIAQGVVVLIGSFLVGQYGLWTWWDMRAQQQAHAVYTAVQQAQHGRQLDRQWYRLHALWSPEWKIHVREMRRVGYTWEMVAVVAHPPDWEAWCQRLAQIGVVIAHTPPTPTGSEPLPLASIRWEFQEEYHGK